jgi:hypothetical protein
MIFVELIVNPSDFACGDVSLRLRNCMSVTVTAGCDNGSPHVARVPPKLKAQYFGNVEISITYILQKYSLFSAFLVLPAL